MGKIREGGKARRRRGGSRWSEFQASVARPCAIELSEYTATNVQRKERRAERENGKVKRGQKKEGNDGANFKRSN